MPTLNASANISFASDYSMSRSSISVKLSVSEKTVEIVGTLPKSDLR